MIAIRASVRDEQPRRSVKLCLAALPHERRELQLCLTERTRSPFWIRPCRLATQEKGSWVGGKCIDHALLSDFEFVVCVCLVGLCFLLLALPR